MTVGIFISCQPQSNSTQEKQVVIEEKSPDKIYNLMGEELPTKALSEKERIRFEQNLEEAKSALDQNPDSLDLIIWHGRRLAYLGKYLEAIEVFSDGIAKYPHSYRLRRHRGHRYLTIRQVDKAIEDFEMAAYYSLNAENVVEPDGLPNRLNRPLSNDQFNIWYHFGLAHYLKGRFDKALSAYTKCMTYCDNDDLKVATTYWQYLTYKKLGNAELAEAALATIHPKMTLIENDAYLDLLLLFKGKLKDGKLLKKATNAEGQLNPTLGYGLGIYFQQQGSLDKANEIFLKVLDSPQWDSFGFIATENELTTIFPVPNS